MSSADVKSWKEKGESRHRSSHKQASTSARSPFQSPSTTSPTSTKKSTSGTVWGVTLPPSLLPRRTHVRPAPTLVLPSSSPSSSGGSSNVGKNHGAKKKNEMASTTTTPIMNHAHQVMNDVQDKTRPLPIRQRSQRPRQCHLGGPGTALPFFVESFLAWTLALACLSVAFWHSCIVSSMMNAARTVMMMVVVMIPSGMVGQRQSTNTNNDGANTRQRLLAVPLCTHSRRELHSASTPSGLMHRCQQLMDRLELEPVQGRRQQQSQPWWSEPKYRERLVQVIRSTETARRLASLIMTTTATTTATPTRTAAEMLPSTRAALLIRVLSDIWPQLLELPELYKDHQNNHNDDDHGYAFDISVIVPLYGEDGIDLKSKLQTAALSGRGQGQQTAPKIEFLLINAGQCQNLPILKEWIHTVIDDNVDDRTNDHRDDSDNKDNNPNLSLRILEFTAGGGRGPCLNYGAQNARGRILTFLHADTRLEAGWDDAVLDAFHPDHNKTHRHNERTTTACAFSFAIDTSSSALRAHNRQGYYPPGLKAIETTANWRTHLFSLPYGDQCLSLPASVFHYLGGYPDQCLMEDYELIRLLRQRASLLSSERLAILPLKAHCSPRRWQAHGVWFVTYLNSYVVHLYNTKQQATHTTPTTPDDLFALYYGTARAPPRVKEASPWELELERELDGNEKTE